MNIKLKNKKSNRKFNRKFKRKKKLRKKNIKILYPFKIKSIEKSEKYTLIQYLNSLPKELQKKIYILCFRFMWRKYVPLSAKIPSWYSYKIQVDNEIFKSRFDNIHFLHLSFNTLPENKQWIMGCQCEYCLNYSNKKLKRKEYKKQCNDLNYFRSIMPESTFYLNEYLTYTHIDPNTLQKFYDPLYGSIYEMFENYAIRNDYPKLNFNI